MIIIHFLTAGLDPTHLIDTFIIQGNKDSTVLQISLQNKTSADAALPAFEDCLMFQWKGGAMCCKVLSNQGCITPYGFCNLFNSARLQTLFFTQVLSIVDMQLPVYKIQEREEYLIKKISILRRQNIR